MSIPKAELDQAIADNNLEKVSQIVQAVLNNATRPYSEAVAAFDYVEQQFPAALADYQADDTPIIDNKEQWSEDYYFEHKVGLSYNFCRARFEHVVEVAKHLEKEGVEGFQKRTVSAPQNEKSGEELSSLAKVAIVGIGAAIVVAAIAILSD